MNFRQIDPTNNIELGFEWSVANSMPPEADAYVIDVHKNFSSLLTDEEKWNERKRLLIGGLKSLGKTSIWLLPDDSALPRSRVRSFKGWLKKTKFSSISNNFAEIEHYYPDGRSRFFSAIDITKNFENLAFLASEEIFVSTKLDFDFFGEHLNSWPSSGKDPRYFDLKRMLDDCLKAGDTQFLSYRAAGNSAGERVVLIGGNAGLDWKLKKLLKSLI